MQGHLDGLVNLGDQPTASVTISAHVSGPFSDTRISSTVHLACSQTTESIGLAQEKATELAMEGLRNGWEILRERVMKGHFPGCAGEKGSR